MLIMDQKVTTQAILGELDDRGVKFATLRMRSPALMSQINALTSKRLQDHHPGPARPIQQAQGHESAAVKLTSYPGTVRQLIVTGLGRDAPTVIITNDHHITTRALIGQYARRMTIEQRLAEIIQAFCADALSSAVNLNVDLDVVLCVLAQALTAAFRAAPARQLRPRHPRHPPAPLPGHPRRDHQHRRPASPSRSTAAPTHPSSATPASPPTPPSPGGAGASSTSNSPDPRAKIRCGKSALVPRSNVLGSH